LAKNGKPTPTLGMALKTFTTNEIRFLLNRYGVYGYINSWRKSSVAYDYLLESMCRPRVVFHDYKKSKISGSEKFLG